MLNRIARNPGGENMAYEPLRKLVKEMLEEMEQQSKSDPRLEEQFAKVKMPLIFFVDSIIEVFTPCLGSGRLVRVRPNMAERVCQLNFSPTAWLTAFLASHSFAAIHDQENIQCRTGLVFDIIFALTPALSRFRGRGSRSKDRDEIRR